MHGKRSDGSAQIVRDTARLRKHSRKRNACRTTRPALIAERGVASIHGQRSRLEFRAEVER